MCGGEGYNKGFLQLIISPTVWLRITGRKQQYLVNCELLALENFELVLLEGGTLVYSKAGKKLKFYLWGNLSKPKRTG